MTAARPTRVTVLDHTAQAGGAELALLRLLCAVDAAEVAVDVVVFEEGRFPELLREAGVEVAVVELDPAVRTAARDTAPGADAMRRVAGFAIRLSRRLREGGTQLVVANSLKSAVVAAIAAPLARRPWVWLLHDRLSPDYLPRTMVLAMRMLAVAGPRAIVANSWSTLATLPRGARHKALVAYPGLPDDAFGPALPGPAVVGIIGRLSPTKGQREFVSAAARLAAARPDVSFRVVGSALFGEDAYESEVRGLPAQLGIDDRVVFTGWSDRPADELRALRVLVHASPVPEPFGQVVAEALAAGVPVVAADAGGVPEILGGGPPDGSPWRDTGIGWLHRPGDDEALAAAIGAALDASDDGERRARGRRRAERMTIGATAAAMVPVWRAAASGRRTSPSPRRPAREERR